MISSNIFHLNRFPNPRLIDSHATKFSKRLGEYLLWVSKRPSVLKRFDGVLHEVEQERQRVDEGLRKREFCKQEFAYLSTVV
jgi:hypothetical protein